MKRNNAALSDGVSRMSPWIHYGMISTTRMVRDASSIGGKGAEKFLDEMLVFREHAQHHVHANVAYGCGCMTLLGIQTYPIGKTPSECKWQS